jgi:MFS superfamily sulfate permease-like transporter
MNFDRAALQGIWRGGLPQVPLTLLNSVLAVSALAVQLYPHRATRVTVTRMALSVGLMNLFVCPLGGLPLCHGSGGLAGQHRLGARSGLSVVMLGGAKLTLGLCFSAAALAWMQAFPVNILGLFLVLAGLSLAEASRFWESRAGILVAAIMIAVHFSTGWLLAALGAGWIVCLVVERKSTCQKPN